MTLESIIATGLSNALAATLLALVAFAASRLARSAPLAHFLWALVIIKLLTPPILEVRLPGSAGVPGPLAPPAAGRVPGDTGRLPEATFLKTLREGHEVTARGGFHPPRTVPADDAAEALVPRAAAVAPAEPAIVLPPPPGAAPPHPVTRETPGPGAILAGAWLSGSLLWYALAASRVLRFRRLLERARPAPPALLEEVRLVACALGLRRPPEVAVLAARVSPLVWALGGRARLVLPEDLAASLTESQRKTLIAHEIAHLVRRDHWLRWAEMLALGLYWWLPVAWWARRELRAAEEECCDAWVGWAYPRERRDYARTILRTVDFLSRRPAAVPEGASGMAQVSNLERRFRMILHGRSTRRLPGYCRAALVLFAALVLPWAAGFTAQDPPDEAGGPAAQEPESSPPREQVRISLGWDAKTKMTLRRIGGQPPCTAEELGAALAKAREDGLVRGGKETIVTIEAARDVPWEDLIEVLDLAKKQRLEVELAALPKAGSGAPSDSGAKVIRLRGKGGLAVIEHDGVSLVDPASGKLKWKTDIKGGSKGAKVRVGARPDDVVVEVPEKTVTLDLDTGKVVRETVTGSDRAARREDVSMMTGPALGFNAPGSLGGSPVDVVQLGSALVEARGALELAKSKLKAMSGTEGVVSQRELMAEKIQLQTAERKIDLLRRIARSALKGTTMEIEALLRIEEMATKRYEAGHAGEDAVLAATLRRAHAQTLASLLEELLQD